MSLFKRRKPEHIAVDLEGLGRLIEDLDTDVLMSEMVDGVQIKVRRHNYDEGVFLVTLSPFHADKLRKRVQSYEFSDVYGPRARPRAGGGAPDGAE